MFGSIGGPELVVIFVLALLIFGPRKLPELGRMLGKGLSEFRRAASELRESLEVEVAREGTSHRDGSRVSDKPSAGPPSLPASPTDSSSDPRTVEAAPTTTPRDAAPEGTGAPDELGREKPL